jgi:SulP family sulfate permease
VIVLIALMKSNGLEYVFAAVALAGVIQILIGLFKLGKFIRLVPQRNVWFCKWFGYNYFYVSAGAVQNSRKWESVWLSGSPMFIMLGLVALTIAIVVFLPKVKAVPASLVAIIVVFDWF